MQWITDTGVQPGYSVRLGVSQRGRYYAEAEWPCWWRVDGGRVRCRYEVLPEDVPVLVRMAETSEPAEVVKRLDGLRRHRRAWYRHIPTWRRFARRSD